MTGTTLKILMILTSHDHLGATGEKTGLWLEELAAPYVEFTRAGAQVDLASPKGGRAPVDPRSEAAPSAEVRAFLADPEAARKLDRTLRLADVDVSRYQAVFVAGGHGVMWDLPGDQALIALLSGAASAGKVVAAVCHGPAALVNVEVAGVPLVRGKRVAGFSNEEERLVKLDQVVPFLLEDRLRALGGEYQRGPTWQPFAVRDGKLVTGQNPASSTLVAREVLKAARE